nr:hypothetical protein CFP56_54440 [Quercus suber]
MTPVNAWRCVWPMEDRMDVGIAATAVAVSPDRSVGKPRLADGRMLALARQSDRGRLLRLRRMRLRRRSRRREGLRLFTGAGDGMISRGGFGPRQVESSSSTDLIPRLSACDELDLTTR